MKLFAQLDEEKYSIDISRKDSKVFADIDGRKYKLEVSSPESNVYLLKHNGNIFEVFIAFSETYDSLVQAKVGNRSFDLGVIDPKRLRATSVGIGGADGVVEIKTSMPGKVVRILLNEGDEVAKGDGVVVVEAMKMQNEMKSPKDGKISKICFQEGETVNTGDILVVIE